MKFKCNFDYPSMYRCKKCSRKCGLEIVSKSKNPERPNCPYGNQAEWIKTV